MVRKLTLKDLIERLETPGWRLVTDEDDKAKADTSTLKPARFDMRSNHRLLLNVFALTVMIWNAPLAVAANAESEKHAILAVVSRMEAAWNRGDFKGYMAGFANPDVIFISRGEYQKDWQGTLDHYIRDYGASDATRGQLRFYDIPRPGQKSRG